MREQPLLTWKGRRVRSPGDSPETAALKVPDAPIRPGSLFFVPSPLEGWGIDVLLDRLPAEGAVVVFEKDDSLGERCRPDFHKRLGARIQDHRLFFLSEDSESAVQDLFSRLPLSRLRRCEFLTFNGAWLSHAARYRQIFSRLEEGLTRWWSNRITSIHMGPVWVRNLFDNLSNPGFQLTPWPDWGNDPVVVCGAGTSLEESLPWIVAHRTRVRLVAADTALPILRAWNLVPDAVVCLEAQQANLRDFAGWRGAPVILFTDLTSHPPGTRVFGTSPCWFASEFAPLEVWARLPWTPEEIPRLPPLGSVGVTAVWIAWRLTSGPTILTGLDFSFPTGKTHARGAPALASLAAKTDRYHPVEQTGTWEGSGVRKVPPAGWLTTPVLEGYAGVLADQGATQTHRTWVWKERGLPLGFLVPPSDWLPRLPLPSSPKAPRPRETSHRARPWLEGERDRWLKVLETFRQMNASPEDQEIGKRLEDQLRALDYLTFSFPDPEFRRDSDWLIRAQNQVRWILSRIQV